MYPTPSCPHERMNFVANHWTLKNLTRTIYMITVIDSVMGSGKTNYMINNMNQCYNSLVTPSFEGTDYEMTKFIYVAPLLDEVDRITNACPNLNFRDPQPVESRKLYHLESLIAEGVNICTTHALFRRITKDMCAQVKGQGYTLVIDEVLSCVELFEDLTRSDRDLLLTNGTIFVEDGTGRLRWNSGDSRAYHGKFNHIKALCDNGNLVLVRDRILWTFPSEFFEAFDDVIVLTYLFEGSHMASYLQAEGLDYQTMTLRDRRLVPHTDNYDEAAMKRRLRGLVTVYEGPMNEIGKAKGKSNPFSVGWLRKQNGDVLARIKATTEHFFKSIAKTTSNDNAWTTYGDVKGKLKGVRYSRGFIPCNAKGTNNHRHKKSLAYLCNRFTNPIILAYFQGRGITVDDKAFALSEMLQWLWRSQIRDGEPITVFIPSERMRTLLKEWLADAPRVSADVAGAEAIAA